MVEKLKVYSRYLQFGQSAGIGKIFSLLAIPKQPQQIGRLPH